MASDENVDLEESRKQEILALEAKISSTNHFEVLGVDAGASTDDVRAAFRELSRKFHPDRYYGKNLGSFRQRLDRIFQRLVEANQTLSDPDRRKAWLAANPFIRAAVRKADALSHTPVPRTETEAARDEERRARFARHPYLARATRQQDTVRRVKEHLDKKEFSQAFSVANQAAQADPNNHELKTLLAEARKLADASRSGDSYQHGLEAMKRGDDDLAISAFRTAVAANVGNHQAAHKLAMLFEKRGADPREATSYAQKAVDAAPDNAEYRLHLGRLLAASGMKALAKKHFDEAARLAPDHPEVKKHGKKLWPF